MNKYLLLSLLLIPSSFTSFTSLPSINLLQPKNRINYHIRMNAVNKNKSSKIIKVNFNNIDDDFRDYDDKLLKINIIFYGYLICLYLYIINTIETISTFGYHR